MERNLMIAGFGGQGVMTMGKLLAEATSESTDLQVSFFPSYGAAMRGGTANCYVVISDDEIGAPVSNNLDDLVVMNGPSLRKFLPNLKPGGNLFINSTIVDRAEVKRDDIRVIEAPVTQMALDIKNERALNVLMLGVYVAVTDAVPEDVIIKGIEHKFEAKPHLIAPNVDAFKMGIEVGLKEKAK
ncbi:MAG: 2-oxoacid:acceptor oxidoreductase family protein [Clostridia bacterium]|nr:2-oxoacid:acceptor oxidoreductase family protein [Clostridia bacterium]MBR0374274.1 2-oxoacid:acceptor oxidoreductase family protein [Mogibacterium sp.]